MTASFLICLAFLSSCHTTKNVAPRQTNPETELIHIPKPDKTEKGIVEEAYTWLGTPYKYACAEKGEGTDCSGMVMKVYESTTGLKIPRNSAKQAEFCRELNAADVEAGDLVFFATGKDSARISHVGIVVDNENFIHASSSKGVVLSKFSNNYYQRTFRMFGRVPGRK